MNPTASNRKRKPPAAKVAARYAVERALPNASMYELRALAGLLALMRFYDKAEDRVSMRMLAAMITGRHIDDVSGWERDRATEGVRALERRGIVKYTPGRGRNALATISFPAPPGDPVDNYDKHQQNAHVFVPGNLSDNGSGSRGETPADSARNTSGSSAKHKHLTGHTEAFTEAYLRGSKNGDATTTDDNATDEPVENATTNVVPLHSDEKFTPKDRSDDIAAMRASIEEGRAQAARSALQARNTKRATP
jgi:hypothetical protein